MAPRGRLSGCGARASLWDRYGDPHCTDSEIPDPAASEEGISILNLADWNGPSLSLPVVILCD